MNKMAIICDTCKEDVTPGNSLVDCEEVPNYNFIQLNGRKVCLCIDCYLALSDFVQSKEFSKVVEKYKKEREFN